MSCETEELYRNGVLAAQRNAPNWGQYNQSILQNYNRQWPKTDYELALDELDKEFPKLDVEEYSGVRLPLRFRVLRWLMRKIEGVK